jgi:hypothetical protein
MPKHTTARSGRNLLHPDFRPVAGSRCPQRLTGCMLRARSRLGEGSGAREALMQRAWGSPRCPYNGRWH